MPDEFKVEMLEGLAKWLNEKKDEELVKKFLTDIGVGKAITAEQVSAFLETSEGKVLIQPYGDQRVTEAVKTRDKEWEKKFEPEVKKRLAAEVLKLNPEESPVEKRMRELEAEIEKGKAEAAASNLKRQIVEEAAKLQIEPFFLEEFMPASLEQGKLFLQKIKDHEKKLTEKTANELMASKSIKPGAGKEDNKNKVDITKLSLEDAIKLEEDGKLDSINK
jgi:hypothetical protein